MTRPCVLHLAVEYPSRNRATNTPAVRNFIQANSQADYRVFALRRTAKPWRCNALTGDDQGDTNVTSMKYWGLPYGLLLFLSMTIVAWRIRQQIQQEGAAIIAVHGHKFTFEGIAAWWLARWLQVPLLLSVRGEAEQKVLRYKPHYRPFFKRQLTEAKRVYLVSAWFRRELNKLYPNTSNQRLLPNFVAERPWQPSHHWQPNKLVTVMDLNVLHKKGLPNLLAAIAKIRHCYPKISLDIYGSGTIRSQQQAQQLIAAEKLQPHVQLQGALPNRQLLKKLPHYAGLVLTSHNETFGMVYVEAMLSGIPVIYSQHTGIDGFVDGLNGCTGTDPDDIDTITHTISSLLTHQQQWRHWLQAHHQLVVQRFDRKHYINEYNQMLASCLSKDTTAFAATAQGSLKE